MMMQTIPLQNETILCVATRVWNSLWRDSQQIMSRMAEQNRVLYFEPGRNPDRPVGVELWRNLPNFATLRSETLHDNLIVIPTPSSLPYARRHLPRSALRVTTPLVAKINAWMLALQIRRAMRAFAVEAPILWLYDPRHVDLIGQFGEKLVCHFNYDEYADFEGNERMRDLLRQYDRRMTSRADVVFATSTAQCRRREKFNPNTHFVPNGVDFDMFHRALEPNLTVPDEIAQIPRPIIGYAGWLGRLIDVDLLDAVARSYPDCSLVLVGPDDLPDRGKRQRLAERSNVYFLGRKEPWELAHYLKAFDVALMPYVLSGHIYAAYPLKLHEYLAAGRAIVSTALPEVRAFDHVVRIAEDHQGFIHQIGEAMHDNAPASIDARVSVARQNTWDQRVATIYEAIQAHLAKREGGPVENPVHRLGQALPSC